MTHSLYTLDDSPWFEWIRLRSTGSTIDFLKHYRPVSPKEMVLVTADFQTAGRGQAGNSWESEPGKNLLFGLLFHPREVEANRQFILSQAAALSVCETLSGYAEDIRIKWPNDIYWKDRKVCGILVENTLAGRCIESCIIGAGVNINQRTFRGGAPNPASLRLITGKEQEPVFVLADIVKRFKDYYREIRQGKAEDIARGYRERLYRRDGFHLYQDADGVFEAEIHDVEPTGHLVLTDRDGITRRYAFKEVSHLIPSGAAPSAPSVL